MKCKYESKYFDGLNCDLDALHDQDYCIIHQDFPKNCDQLNEAVKDKINDNDFNFEGSKLNQFIYYNLKTNQPIIFRDAIIKNDIKLSSKDPDIEDSEFGALNFRGAQIGGNIELIQTTIKGQVNFGNDTEVGGNIKFHSSFIGGNVDFTDIEVDGGVFFPYTIINGNVNFSRAKIHNDIKFSNSEIGYNAIFNYMYVGQNLFFNLDLDNTEKTHLKGKKLEVKGEAEFSNIMVRGIANFNGIDIGENFNLVSSNIYGSFNFEDSKIGTLDSQRTINKVANFSNTEISGDADFTRAKFFGDAIFMRTKFRGNSYFDDTIFSKKADYEESKFDGNANFVDTDFTNESNFAKASFLSTGLFSGIKNTLKLNSSFEESRLRNVAFRRCNLSQALFQYAIFDNCELSLAIWPEGYKILEYTKYEENKKMTRVNSLKINSLGILWSPELVEEARLVANTYQRIRLNLQHEGEYELAGKFYVREMDLKREILFTENIYMWLIYTSLSLITGYGEKLRNILTIFLIYLGIYIIAVYYLAVPSNNLVIPIGSGILSIFTALLVYVFARKISR